MFPTEFACVDSPCADRVRIFEVKTTPQQVDHTFAIRPSTMRLPYVANPPSFTAESDKAIVRRVQERRGVRGLRSLDLALLHSPPVADGWNAFLGAIRSQTTITASIREMVICRVAVLNEAWYEWQQHAPLIPSDCVSLAGIEYIFSSAPFTHSTEAATSSGLDEKHLAVLSYTDYSTLKIEVPKDVFHRLRTQFSDREVVEITATVGCYNCVSRFLVALDVGERNGPDAMALAVEHTAGKALAGAKPAERTVD